MLKEIKLILKLVNKKLESFELIKKVDIFEIIKKVYRLRIKKYLNVFKTIILIKRYTTFLKIKKKVENYIKTYVLYV